LALAQLLTFLLWQSSSARRRIRLRITLRMRRVLKLHHSCESISVGGAVMQRFMIKKHSVE